MKLRSHIVASVIFSSIFFLVFKSWSITVSSLISGVLIDCDHVLDYLLKFKKRFRVKKLFDTYNKREMLFFMVILHSWELLFLLNIYAFLMSDNSWIIGITIGFTQHVVLDQIFNHLGGWQYFFFWRVKKGFNLKKMYPKLIS